MFLTTAEATLIGVAMAGAISVTSSWLTLRATRSKEHQQRIWDRATDLYEHLLFEARTWAVVRDSAMQTFMTDGDLEILANNDAEHHRILIRLEMLGHSRVKAAFERYFDAHWEWMNCQNARDSAFERNAAARDQQIPDPVPHEEIVRLGTARLDANEAAEERHRELREAIQHTVRRIPKPDRTRRRMS